MSPSSPTFLAIDWNGTVVPIFGGQVYSGAREVLEELRTAGMPLFVVSCASQEQIERDVARTGLRVDGIFGCGDKGPVFSKLRLQHGVGMVFGDQPSDRRAAASAGIPFLQACLDGQMGFPEQDEVFRHWREVPTLLLAGRVAEG